MRESISNTVCARAEDLVTYLYGEATENQSLDFERHIKQCVLCSTELATFGDIRGAVGEWRQQVLGSLPAHSYEASAAVAPARGRSAIAALREFFTLSPVWMRAATAMAVLAFFALATIAVAFVLQRPQTVIVATPGKTGYTEEELSARIDEALQRENERRAETASRAQSESLAAPRVDQRGALTENKQRASSGRPGKRQPRVLPDNIPTPSEAEALASSDYLPFTAPGSEEKLPTLSDLVDDNED